jgi:hypothetical protein
MSWQISPGTAASGHNGLLLQTPDPNPITGKTVQHTDRGSMASGSYVLVLGHHGCLIFLRDWILDESGDEFQFKPFYPEQQK